MPINLSKMKSEESDTVKVQVDNLENMSKAIPPNLPVFDFKDWPRGDNESLTPLLTFMKISHESSKYLSLFEEKSAFDEFLKFAIRFYEGLSYPTKGLSTTETINSGLLASILASMAVNRFYMKLLDERKHDFTRELIPFCFNYDRHNIFQYTLPYMVNITRRQEIAEFVRSKYPYSMKKIVMYTRDSVRCNETFYLFLRLALNLTMTKKGRGHIVEPTQGALVALINKIEPEDSEGWNLVYGIVKNCTFDDDIHAYLLGDQVDVLGILLLPLAGGEKFTEEEADKLPAKVRYLPASKTRETDPVVRRTVLEAILQLCSTKDSREKIRQANIYVILREYHKWEKEEHLLELTENIVNLLLRTEEEIGVDNLRNLDDPTDLVAASNK